MAGILKRISYEIHVSYICKLTLVQIVATLFLISLRHQDLGTNATLDIFKKQAFRFSILHLGTHGCFDLAGCPNLDMQANTILFANKEQYNIADAALLGLKNTELITLSACQTAKEANADGQEISGLAYVLERAGAKSVIASLWNAEDNTSDEIMTQFYQNLNHWLGRGM